MKKAGIKVYGNLQTVKSPVFDRKKKKELFSRGIDFIDMECFYIAKKFPFLIPIKVVTDTPKFIDEKEHFLHILKGLDMLKSTIACLFPIL